MFLWPTVDGRNPASVGMEDIPLFRVFYTSQVVQEFFHQKYDLDTVSLPEMTYRYWQFTRKSVWSTPWKRHTGEAWLWGNVCWWIQFGDAVLKHVLASKSYETEIFFTGEIEEVTWSQVNVILFVCLAGTHYTIEFLNTRYLSVHLLKVIKRKY